MPKKSKSKTAPAQTEEAEHVDIINYDDYDQSRLALKAQDVKRQETQTQFTCFPKYAYDGEPNGDYDKIMEDGGNVLVVTNDIVMNKGGIPRYNAKYHDHEDTMKRAYFYIARDDECAGSVELFDFARLIDNYYDEEINKLGNKNNVVSYIVSDKKNGKDSRKPFKGLTYKPIITMTKKPTSMIEDDEDDKKPYIPYERIKVKFATIYDEDLGPDDLREIETVLFIPGEDEPIPATKVTHFDKYFRWKSTSRFGLMINKFWIAKTDERTCSFGIKCVQLSVTELAPHSSSNATNQLRHNLFTGKKITKAAKKEEIEKKSDNDSSDSSSDEDSSDEESEVDVESNDDDSDSDEDEENEENEENNDDDDVAESDEESEEEVPVPKKKTRPAKKTPVKVRGKAPAPKGKKSRK